MPSRGMIKDQSQKAQMLQLQCKQGNQQACIQLQSIQKEFSDLGFAEGGSIDKEALSLFKSDEGMEEVITELIDSSPVGTVGKVLKHGINELRKQVLREAGTVKGNSPSIKRHVKDLVEKYEAGLISEGETFVGLNKMTKEGLAHSKHLRDLAQKSGDKRLIKEIENITERGSIKQFIPESGPVGSTFKKGFAEGGEVSNVEPMVSQDLTEEELVELESALDMHPMLEGIIEKLVELAPSTTKEEFDGAIEGAGTGTSDSIDAKLSDGEFVFTAKAVKQLGVDKLRKMMSKAEEDYDSALGDQTEKQLSEPAFACGGLMSKQYK